MTRLYYNSKGELTGVDLSGARYGFVLFKIEGATEGVLQLGDLPFKLSEGFATVRVGSLPDGDYTPKCHTGGGTLTLEPICKRGRLCQPLPPSTEQLIAIRERITALEKELKALSGAIAEVKEALGSNTIF